MHETTEAFSIAGLPIRHPQHRRPGACSSKRSSLVAFHQSSNQGWCTPIQSRTLTPIAGHSSKARTSRSHTSQNRQKQKACQSHLLRLPRKDHERLLQHTQRESCIETGTRHVGLLPSPIQPTWLAMRTKTFLNCMSAILAIQNGRRMRTTESVSVPGFCHLPMGRRRRRCPDHRDRPTPASLHH